MLNLKTTTTNTIGGLGMGAQLTGLQRCPHCSIASPRFTSVWASPGPTPRTDGGQNVNWGAYCCSSCGSAVVVRAQAVGNTFAFTGVFPDAKAAHEDIPEPARTFLQQAYETLHAPDAAAVMAGSAVDAMLKAHGLESGSLYARIDEALTKNLLTRGMADWATMFGSVRTDQGMLTRENPTYRLKKPSSLLNSSKLSETFYSFSQLALTAGYKKRRARQPHDRTGENASR